MGAVGVAEIAAQRESVISLVRELRARPAQRAADCALVRQHATAMKNAAATLESLAAARVAETQLATETGAQTAAHDHAVSDRHDQGHAHRTRSTPRHDCVTSRSSNEAVRSGELSLEQAALISDAAAANPARERDLVDKAKTDSLRGLRDECDRAKQAADPDPDATQARVHRQREFKMWTDGDVAKYLRPVHQGPADRHPRRHRTQDRPALQPSTRRRPARTARGLRHGRLRSHLQRVARRPRPPGDAKPAKPRVASRPVAILRLDYEALAPAR